MEEKQNGKGITNKMQENKRNTKKKDKYFNMSLACSKSFVFTICLNKRNTKKKRTSISSIRIVSCRVRHGQVSDTDKATDTSL